ncbi:MAG TPA: PilZ domain-containing protein [Sphingomonadaceae bacterium]|nr:PilZ domain-containing protein [Sphingomonadaceae bacterium]
MTRWGSLDDQRPPVAKCRSRSGSSIELPIIDISASGCLVDRLAWSARPNDQIKIALEGLASRPATVVWVEDDRAGIAFETMLYEPVVNHLRAKLPVELKQAC